MSARVQIPPASTKDNLFIFIFFITRWKDPALACRCTITDCRCPPGAVSEWRRRQTANLMLYEREGSNPSGIDEGQPFHFHLFYHEMEGPRTCVSLHHH